MSKRLRVATLLCIACAPALTACTSDDDASTSDASAGAPDGECDPARGSVDACETLTCEERDQVAQSWLDSLDDCEVDADCMLVDLPDCMSAFICDVPVSTDVDDDALQQTAEELSAQHGAECSCVLARCLPATGVVCTDGTCVAEYE
jgi:hypothetical protein